MKHTINVTLAGVTFSCTLRFQETARFFPPSNAVVSPIVGESVCLSDDDWQYFLTANMVECPHSEYSLLTAPFSDALLSYDRMVFHSVALRWHDRAYLISAPSGNGKSTQARYLKKLHPGEFGIICGDRPILSFYDNEIIVHPSPWNGKENWHDAEAAPLAGLILLERGNENKLIALSPREAALRTYAQVMQRCIDPEKIRRAAELTTRLLNSVPIWP